MRKENPATQRGGKIASVKLVTENDAPKNDAKPSHKPNKTELQPLLVDRAEAARLLCCSRDTIIRMQQAGRLNPVRLTGSSPQSCVYYRIADLHRIADGG